MLFATLVCVAWFGVCLNVLHFSGTTITHHYSISIEHKSTKSPEIGLTRHEGPVRNNTRQDKTRVSVRLREPLPYI
jgi:hypothetical protein